MFDNTFPSLGKVLVARARGLLPLYFMAPDCQPVISCSFYGFCAFVLSCHLSSFIFEFTVWVFLVLTKLIKFMTVAAHSLVFHPEFRVLD